MWSLATLWQRYQRWWRGLDGVSRALTLGVVVATAIGAVYRLYILPQTMQFLADQGRDALIAYGILHGDVALVGPSTSVGSMFLGPFYYYFMAPFIWLAGNNPLGPAYAVAIIGIVTIPVLYLVGSRLVGRWAAFFATMLYAVGPYVAEYTRFSWNPNPAPLVSLGIAYATLRAWRGSARWWIVVGALWALIIQLHYVAALVIAPSAIIFLADLWRSRLKVKRLRSLGVAFLWAALIVIVSFVPLVVFNWRFDNLILKGFQDFASSDTTSASRLSETTTWTKIFSEQHGRTLQLLFEVWGAKDWTPWYRQINSALLAAYACILGVATVVAARKRWFEFGYTYLVLMLITSALGLAFYRSTVFFHYIAYFFPFSYLITGVVLVTLARLAGRPGALVAFLLMSYVFWLSVNPTSLLYLKPLGWTSQHMSDTADVVLEKLPANATYTVASLSEVRDYRGMNYRYFLVTSPRPPVPLERAMDADVLVVIAENPRDQKAVLESPVYELSAFPKGAVESYEIPGGPVIYIIRRT